MEKASNWYDSCAVLSRFSHVQLLVTPWTVALQVPLSMGFSRQEYWSGLLCPSPGDLPDPGIKIWCLEYIKCSKILVNIILLLFCLWSNLFRFTNDSCLLQCHIPSNNHLERGFPNFSVYTYHGGILWKFSLWF